MPYFTGLNRIDNLLDTSEPHWNGAGNFNSPASVTFSFAQFAIPGGLGGDQTPFSDAQENAARAALQQWANVANISFTEVVDTGTFNGDSASRGDINYINEDISDTGLLAFAFLPIGAEPKSLFEESGDVHFNSNVAENTDALGEFGQGSSTLFHETGHALGLIHADEGPVFAALGQATDRFTVMGTNTGLAVFGDLGVFSTSPRINDIAAIQQLYGANTSFNAGTTVYAYDDSKMFFETIWDGGGTDTIVYTGITDAIIDLRQGKFSSIGLLAARGQNIGIAFGAVIEDATGGGGNDTIFGNGIVNTLVGGEGDDRLFGGAGNDRLFGNRGNDTLSGQSGADLMEGGEGNDTFIVDNLGDLAIEKPAEGIDRILSFIDFTLPNNIENLTLRGAGDIDGTGNSLVNVITGNSGRNTLSGGVGNDRILGGAGNDSLFGNTGADTLIGGTGNDRLSGGTGADRMEGGVGNDTFIVDNVGDVVVELAGSGIDLVQSSITFILAGDVENLTLTGTSDIDGTGNDLSNAITGNDGANTLAGGLGNDTLMGNGGADTLLGNSGNDRLFGGAGDDVLTGGAGNDRSLGQFGNDTLTGQGGSDRLFGGAGNDVISGGTGSDLLVGQAGADTLLGNAGADRLFGGDGADRLFGGTGADTLNGGAGADRMEGGPGNDSYTVDNAGDTVIEQANAGTDTVLSSISFTLSGTVENLTLLGSAAIAGTGNGLVNVILGNTGANILTGGAGNDQLSGRIGNDQLFGGSNDDVLSGGSGADRLFGQGGNDTLTGQDGNDLLDGGAGDDVLAGGQGADSLAGKDGADTLLGNAGDDSLLGGAGDDNLIGGTGADTLDGGSGADRMEGGAGNDSYTVDNAGDTVIEQAAAGTDSVLSSVNFILSGNVENLTLAGAGNINGTGNGLGNVINGNNGVNVLNGGSGNDTLSGFGGADTLIGQVGDDRLFGGGGNDVLAGGAGNDLLFGQFGDDTLLGQAGNDRLFGGAGNDTLVGGGGDDLFVFTNGGGDDTINDFTTGAGSDDVLDVRAFGFASAAAAIAAATQVGADTVIALDADDSVTLIGVTVGTLNADDFLI